MKTKTKTTFLSLLAIALAATPEARAISDSFANATVIEQSNEDSGDVNIMAYTVENGEPGHKAGNAGAQKSAWWRWTAPSNGFCTVDSILSDDPNFVYDTVLSVYTGATVNALTRIAYNDDHHLSPADGAYRSASVTFYAVQGTVYHLAVDGYDANSVTATRNKVQLRLRHLAATPETRLGNFAISAEGLHGSLQLNKTAGHAFSAKLLMTGKTYPFKGVFGLDGYYIVSFERKVAVGATPLPPITMLIDGAQHGKFEVVTGLYPHTEAELRTVQRFTAINSCSTSGMYTAGISSSGTLSLKVTTLGVATGTVLLPDGTKTTFGSSICVRDATTSSVPFYTSLHANTGFFNGYLKLTEAGAVDQLDRDAARYVRPAKPGALFYPAGLSLTPSILGSTYVVPALNTRALGFLDATTGAGKLSISMQNPEINPAIMENLNLDIKNVIKFATPLVRKPVLTLNKTTGQVTGSINDQVGKKRTLTGILFRTGNSVILRGQLTGATMNPVFEVIP